MSVQVKALARSLKRYAGAASIGLIALFGMVANANAADAEIAATVESIDVASNTVVLRAIDIPGISYTFAYDVRIRLLNGDQGAVGNVREGDVITALVDKSENIIEALFVVGP